MSLDKGLSDYFNKIQDTFDMRRGKIKLLSPNDWFLMEDWYQRGVPVEVVLESINYIFDANNSKPRPAQIHSLAYFKRDIEERFIIWQGKETESEINYKERLAAARWQLTQLGLNHESVSDTKLEWLLNYFTLENLVRVFGQK